MQDLKSKLFLISIIISGAFALPSSITSNIVSNKIDDKEVAEENTDELDNYIDLTQFAANAFGEPDTRSGDVLSKWTPDQKVNPEELGSYLEGDILIPTRYKVRNGLVSRSSRWPNGVVPYVIEGSFSSNELDTIKRGMNEYHSKTCIRFKPRTNERDYVAIVNDGSGCWSSVGRLGGRQEINLQSPGCLVRVGTFMHEAMHALGFLHEQNRYERDDYVSIMWDNIMPSTRVNFGKASSVSTSGYGVPYDYGSVMHYSAYAFSRNGQATIIPKHTWSSDTMGQRRGFSDKDIQKLNNMYDCKINSISDNGISAIGNIFNNLFQGANNSFLNLLGNVINNIANRIKDRTSEKSSEDRTSEKSSETP